MPRPNSRAPKLGQESLFDDEQLPREAPGHVLRGRHSDAVDGALAAAFDADLLDSIDGALATAVRSSAWALDAAEATNRPYLPSKMVPAMVEAIRELGLTPEARKADTNDQITKMLADLANADDTTQIPH